MRIHRRRTLAAILAALSVPLCGPTLAAAVPADYPRPVPESTGATPSDFTRPAPKIGDTPAEFPGTGTSTVPQSAAKAGDSPVDFPGASRSPEYSAATTIEVVRPERTIVRDVDPALPIVLAGLALLVALGMAGTGLARTRRGMVGRAG